MKKRLLRTFARYPQMQLCDMVKLICQNEYAGGHLIKNPNDSLKMLEEECGTLTDTGRNLLFEDIGNGLCRLHLHALAPVGISPATANRLFVATANTVSGSVDSLEQKLRILQQCCKSGTLPFDPSEVENDIATAKEIQGCPPINHSAAYHAAYHPAYRVIKTAYADYIDAFKRIDALLESGKSVTVAIEGGSGSGKTTFAGLLLEVYDCNVFHMDDFFLPPHLKTPERLSQPGANVDVERFLTEVMAGVQSGKDFSYRPYSCKTSRYADAVPVCRKALNIVEGVYSMHPALSRSYDLKLFLKIDNDTQRARIRKRSGIVLFKRFIQEWIPMENAYFEAFGIEQSCDLTFPD